MGDCIEHLRFTCQGFQEHVMDREWNDSQPIYRQLRDRVVAMILDGVLKEGDPLPSVRSVAAEYRVNPLTVLKGYQQLVDEQLVESRRGRGMFINSGARNLLLRGEREKFLSEEWPRVHATIQRLGLTPEELLEASGNGKPTSDSEEKER
jgi:GntR family transcriptional regulator